MTEQRSAGRMQVRRRSAALIAVTWWVLQAACSTYGAATRPDQEQEQSQSPEQPTERKKKARQKPKQKPEPVAKPGSDSLSFDLSRSAKGDTPEAAALRQQLFTRFSIDELLRCAKEDAVACPSPVTVRLRVGTEGVVQSVNLKPAKPENKVWLGCLEETYKKIQFDPQPAATSIKTRFHVDCATGSAP